jgi:lipoprotein-anchoring transpeptidase ErfK/SrfK
MGEDFDVGIQTIGAQRVWGRAGVLLVAVLLASACNNGAVTSSGAGGAGAGQKPGTSASPTQTPTPQPSPAVLEVVPADHATGVRPGDPISVRATSGRLRSVTVTDGAGQPVTGAMRKGAWGSAGLLKPGTAYTVTINATGPDGTASTTTSSFRTLTPAVMATYSLIPNGGTVGVGMPVIVQFDSQVMTKAMRAEVEKRVKVTTSPRQAGSWGWLDNRQLMWRPVSFWKPGTRVTLSAPLTGVQTGVGKYVGNDASTSFTIGSAMVSTVNMRTHRMTVTQDGRTIRTFKVSTGKPGPKTETRYGTKVIIERESALTMDSATVGIPKGDPNYYKIKTKWNLRLTWTGEFIHSAPWSTSAQGSANVSHGCTNMAPADAEWMFTHSKMGDVVNFTGSTRAFKPTEGIGVWVYSYAGWKAQSALV